MAQSMDLPFKRGTTFFGGATTDATSGRHLEGQTYVVQDTIHGTNKPVTLKVVRNTGAAALESRRVVMYEAGADYGKQVDGYTCTTASQRAGVVDDAYAASGNAQTTIPVNDLGYIVVEGPVNILSALEGDISNSISNGSIMVALTGATSGATTSGRMFCALTFGVTEQALADRIQNALGRAMTALTTGQTNTACLVQLERRMV